MGVITLLVANSKSSLLEEQSEDNLDDTAVLSQTASIDCVSSSDSWNDPFGSQGPANLFLGIIGSVRMQLHWHFASSTARTFDGRNRIHQWYRQLGVMDIGPDLDQRERDPLVIDDEMPFRAIFSRDQWDWDQFSPPKSARTELLSYTTFD